MSLFPNKYWFDIADQSFCIKIDKLFLKISVIPVSTYNYENTDKKKIYCEKCNDSKNTDKSF